MIPVVKQNISIEEIKSLQKELTATEFINKYKLSEQNANSIINTLQLSFRLRKKPVPKIKLINDIDEVTLN